MAKGFEANQERLRQLSQLGRELTRRSRAKCELCTRSGVPLVLYEVPPVPNEPELERMLHLCEACSTQLKKPKTFNPNHWRILTETIWSEVPAAQVMAIRILRYLEKREPWAREVLENACLDEELEAWINQEGIE